MQSRSEARLGNRIALAASMLTAVTFAIAVLTPPLSGPLCAAGCLDYPYSEAASRFPRDYWWMYPALGATALQAMLMACLHGRTRSSSVHGIHHGGEDERWRACGPASRVSLSAVR